jgi:hypothetical protein
MYRDKITKKEIEQSNKQMKTFFYYITKCTGWYKETKNGDFIITEFGKEQSDNNDYINGLGRPYEEMRN